MRNASSEAKWVKRLADAGAQLESVASGRGCKALPDGVMQEIRILLPGPKRGDCLVVLKASRGEDAYVAFVGGPDPVTAMLMWQAKERGAGVKFRPDVWVPGVGEGD